MTITMIQHQAGVLNGPRTPVCAVIPRVRDADKTTIQWLGCVIYPFRKGVAALPMGMPTIARCKTLRGP
jgi:hypothetical protein